VLTAGSAPPWMRPLSPLLGVTQHPTPPPSRPPAQSGQPMKHPVISHVTERGGWDLGLESRGFRGRGLCVDMDARRVATCAPTTPLAGVSYGK